MMPVHFYTQANEQENENWRKRRRKRKRREEEKQKKCNDVSLAYPHLVFSLLPLHFNRFFIRYEFYAATIRLLGVLSILFRVLLF